YRWIVAVSGSSSSQECIRLLNAGADYYIDAWLPPAELVTRVKVVLRFSDWLAESYDHGTMGHQPIPNTAGSRTHQSAMRKVPAASSATALNRASRSGRAASQRRSRPRPTIATSRKTTASRAMLPRLWSTKTKAPSAGLWVAAAYSKTFTKSANGRPIRNAPISPPISTSLTDS